MFANSRISTKLRDGKDIYNWRTATKHPQNDKETDLRVLV